MIATIEPAQAGIRDVVVLPRPIHRDPRGFLVETMRTDDVAVDGASFAMSYTSVTVPGQMRDRDRWHVHRRQVDRFVVPTGEMILALLDGRPASPTRGRLDLLRMRGAPADSPAGPGDLTTHLVTIPVGVYHAIGNLHPREPFLLQNYPTRLYDPTDEGRVPFAQAPLEALGGRPFDWALVEVRRP